jgi:hypothetical protein
VFAGVAFGSVRRVVLKIGAVVLSENMMQEDILVSVGGNALICLVLGVGSYNEEI